MAGQMTGHVPKPLQPYWNYRDELTVQNQLIYKGAQVMIPQSMQTEMLRKIHANHFGAESNIRMAREVLFWPGMTKAIEDMCNSCNTCAQYGKTATENVLVLVLVLVLACACGLSRSRACLCLRCPSSHVRHNDASTSTRRRKKFIFLMLALVLASPRFVRNFSLPDAHAYAYEFASRLAISRIYR